jgi:hypothetical protein
MPNPNLYEDDENNLEMVEIAKYPIKCFVCGKTDMVRVTFDPALDFYKDKIRTFRIPPKDWGHIVEQGTGQPRWICPDCSK